jgi:hypothetical protein
MHLAFMLGKLCSVDLSTAAFIDAEIYWMLRMRNNVRRKLAWTSSLVS